MITKHYLDLNEAPAPPDRTDILKALEEARKALQAGKVAIDALLFISEDEYSAAGIYAESTLRVIADLMSRD